MTSMESYDVLRKEFKQFLLGGEAFVDGDEFLSLFFSSVKSAKDVLGGARRLKEEGNSFFKKGEIDDALERYGYAGVVLVHFNFEKDEDKLEFLDLAISILLNFTACLSKQKEFQLVGQICSIIIDHSPRNVKAMFRRAKAAIELKKYDLAYWDLVMASEIDPNNREVNKELMEVSRVLGEMKLKKNGERESPIGLGVGLSSKKGSFGKVTKEEMIAPNQQQEDHINAKECESGFAQESMGVEVGKGSLSNIDMEVKEWFYSNEDKNLIEQKEIVRDEVMEETTYVNGENTNLTEPKYRFTNRRRSGSTLSIKKHDYELLMRGKSIQYFNSRFGSLMTIRVVPRPVNGIDKVVTSQEKKENEMKQEAKDVDLMGTSSETSSCMTSEGIQAAFVETSDDSSREDDVCSSNIDMVPLFRFSAKHGVKTRRKTFEVKNHGSPQVQESSKKRRKVYANKVSSSPFTNDDCGCRFEVGKKRKCAHPPLTVLCNRPRKKFTNICNCHVNEECLSYCCYACFLGMNSVKDYVTYEKAHGQSNRF